MSQAATPIGEVHLIPLEIALTDLDSGFGQNGDLAVNMPISVIYQKILGTWTQIYPPVIT